MPKIIDHDQYRKTLLEQAFALFAERGYATVTMRDVAEALNVSTGTLYHYFPNKEALLKGLMHHLVERDELAVLAQTKQAQNKRSPHSTLEVLLDYVEQNETYFRQQLQLMVDYRQVHGQHTPELEAVALKYRHAVQRFTGLSNAEVTVLLSQILGLVLLRMVEGQQQDFVEQSKPLLDWFASHRSQDAN